MCFTPLLPTDIAELISTAAGHMVTSIVFLEYHFALITFSEFIIAFHKKHTILIAVSLVLSQKALSTEFYFTDRTNYHLVPNINEPLTILGGADVELLVSCQIYSDRYFLVYVLLSKTERFNVGRVYLQSIRAFLVQAFGDFELFDLILNVQTEALLAKGMSTFFEWFELIHLELAKANGAFLSGLWILMTDSKGSL
jgi:hypothetical protein